MAKKFLSVLGTNNYKSCIYDTNNRIETKYVQEALVKQFCNEWTESDSVIIFLTKEARVSNWFNKEIKEQRLKNILFECNERLQIKDVNIPAGKNENEIWKIFNIIMDNIDEDDEIIFDITNGFRSIPMLVLVVLNYVKVIKNVKILGIYYGAYDARVTIDNKDVVPIFNLTSFNDLLEWTDAINSFLKYGISDQIKEVSNYKLVNEIKSGNKQSKNIKEFVERLNDFTNDIYTCRGKSIKGEKNSCRKSINSAYSALKEKLDNISHTDNDLVQPLKPLFDKVLDRISDFSADDNFYIGLAVVKWSIDNNLIQQGYTALDETVKTYLCQKFKLNDSEYDFREEIVNNALNIKIHSIEKSKWRVEDKYIDIVDEIVNKIDDELVNLCNAIKARRNDINHFGFQKSSADYIAMKKDLSKLYNNFMKITNNSY